MVKLLWTIVGLSTPTARPRSPRRGWPAPGAGNATPALSAGSSTYPNPATVLDEAAGREGQGELTWHNATGTGTGTGVSHSSWTPATAS